MQTSWVHSILTPYKFTFEEDAKDMVPRVFDKTPTFGETGGVFHADFTFAGGNFFILDCWS